ncbi:MAG: RES family NAD+ phosphorylase [Thermoanaerobaculia bacterium]
MTQADLHELKRAAARAVPGLFHARPWRVVEAQHVVATRKLVDTHEEQAVLEELIDRAKPPLPPEPEFDGLHYLLATPFRHPPLAHGSRFGTRSERSLWYGADRLPTVLAEAAYYRLVFLEGTEAEVEPLLVDLSCVRARVRSQQGLDLTAEPFAGLEAHVSSPVSYAASQALGRELRAAGVEAFRYRSARDPEGGTCVALVTPRAFARREPEALETWYCVATRAAVELSRRDLAGWPPAARLRRVYRFPREVFEVDGELPMPAP